VSTGVFGGRGGRVAARRVAFKAFADSLPSTNEVWASNIRGVITWPVASKVGRVMVANPMHAGPIAEATAKTERVDAEVLGQLLGNR
jgi:hypothetical protein